jgi:hypothetical protein
VIDIWTIGPTAAAVYLRRQGFTPQQAVRLVDLRLRHDRGELNELTYEACRRRFYRWLVQHGRLTDWPQNGAGQPGVDA